MEGRGGREAGEGAATAALLLRWSVEARARRWSAVARSGTPSKPRGAVVWQAPGARRCGEQGRRGHALREGGAAAVLPLLFAQ